MNINSLNKLNSKVGMTENKINKIEDAAIELTPSEQQRENRLKKKKKNKNRALETCGTVTKNLYFFLIRAPEGEKRI